MTIITPAISRRAALGTFAAGAASLVYPFRGAFAASDNPVKIGMVDPRTGTYAALGESEITGAQLALDQVNKAGGIMGRPVQLPHRGFRCLARPRRAESPPAGEQREGQLPDGLGVLRRVAVAEPDRLRHENALRRYRRTHRPGHRQPVPLDHLPHLLHHLAAHRRKFRDPVQEVRQALVLHYPDYAFGHSEEHDYAAQLKKAGGTLLGNALSPLGTTDFSSYLIKAREAKPDVLILLTAGNDLVNCMKQAVQFGMQKQMAIAGALQELEVLSALPEEARLGWWTFEWWWNQPGQPHVKEFVADYKKRSGGKVPSARSWFGFASLHAIAMAANKAKSLDSMKVAKAMEGLELPPEVALQPHKCYYDAKDHQMLANMFPGQVIQNSHYPDLFKVADIVPSEKIAKTAAESGCKMTYSS